MWISGIADGRFVGLVDSVDLRVERVKRPVLKRVKVRELAKILDQTSFPAFNGALARKDASKIGVADWNVDAKNARILTDWTLNRFAFDPGIDRVYIDRDRDFANHFADASHCYRLRGQSHRDR